MGSDIGGVNIQDWSLRSVVLDRVVEFLQQEDEARGKVTADTAGRPESVYFPGVNGDTKPLCQFIHADIEGGKR